MTERTRTVGVHQPRAPPAHLTATKMIGVGRQQAALAQTALELQVECTMAMILVQANMDLDSNDPIRRHGILVQDLGLNQKQAMIGTLMTNGRTNKVSKYTQRHTIRSHFIAQSNFGQSQQHT